MNRSGRLLASVVIVGAFAVLAGDAFARRQVIINKGNGPLFGEDAKAGEFTDAVTLPTDREAKRLIQAAQDYSRKKEWRVAAECLQQLLDAREDSFIEVKRPGPNGATVTTKASVRTEANRILGSLPTEGREFYQVTYGPAAADKLKAALAAADAEGIADVAGRYLHTKAGAEATEHLGTYHLDRGRYLMAAICFERLLGMPGTDKPSAKLLFKASLAARRAGELKLAEQWYGQMTALAGRDGLAFGARKLTLDQLRREYDRAAGTDTSLVLRETPLYRGNPSRTGQAVGSTAYLDARWKDGLLPAEDPVTLKIGQANAWIRQYLAIAAASLDAKPSQPGLFAVTAGDRLIVRSHDAVIALALRDGDYNDNTFKAGERVWEAIANGSLFKMVLDPLNRSRLQEWYDNYYRANNVGPLGVLSENALIGSLSHDGQRVYYVDDIAVPPHPNMIAQQAFGGSQSEQREFTQLIKASKLVASSLDTGKWAWVLGGAVDRGREPAKRDADDKPATPAPLSADAEFENAFVLGPPLPLDGKLYVLIEKAAELRLVCLDPSKLLRVEEANNVVKTVPELVWVQSLGTANNPLPQDSLRRLQPAHLAYADGILISPTNAGALLGVDLLSHSLVWAHAYREPAAPGEEPTMGGGMPGGRIVRGRWAGMPNVVQTPLPERWRPSAPAVQNGRVVFTAHDSQSLQCLNLRDGRVLWKAGRQEGDLYLAGVFGDRVVVVGATSVRCLDLMNDGKELWRQEKTGQPSGQGVASDGIYYLPLRYGVDSREPEVCAIELATGRIVGRPRSRQRDLIPGNLLFAGGDLVSVNAQGVAAFPQLKMMLAEITRRLQANPSDPVALAERGELHLDKGDLVSAVADLRTALTKGPPPATGVRAKQKLYESLSDLLQRDFAAGEPYLDEFRALGRLDVPADADAATKAKLGQEQLRRDARFLCLLGRGREGQGRPLDAFAAYEQLGDATGTDLLDLPDEPTTRARPDVLSRGRIQGLVTRANPEQRQQLDAAVARRWGSVRDGDLPTLRRFAAVFGGVFPAGQEARLALADRLIATGSSDDLTEAERALEALCYSPEERRAAPEYAARALEALVRVYLKRGQYEAAVGFFRQLGSEFATVPVRDGKTGGELFNELATDKRFLPYLEPAKVSWAGEFKASIVTDKSPPMFAALAVEPEGELPTFYERHRLVLETSPQGNNAWTLKLLDRATNRELWRVPGLPAALYLAQPGGRDDAGRPAARPRFAFARGHLLVLHLGHMVMCFDLLERREVWRYNLYGKNPVLNALNGNTNGTHISADEFGLSVVFSDGRKEPLGQVAVVEAGFVAVQTRDGLVALDPAKPGPAVLWTKADVPAKSLVFGDARHLYVAEGSKIALATTRCLRADDGATVAVPDFAPLLSKRVRTVGRCLLVADEAGSVRTLRLADAHTGGDVWQRRFVDAAAVVRSEVPGVTGAVSKDGTVELLATATGRTVLKAKLDPDHVEKLQDLTVLQDGDLWYLAITWSAEGSLTWQPYAGNGLRSVRINGPLYALDRTTGELMWMCRELAHQYLVTDQAADLPVLLFASQYTRMGPNNAPEKQAVRVAAVDKRTGKLLFDQDLTANSQFHELRSNPATGSIELVRQDLKLVLQIEGLAAAGPAAPAAPPAGRPRLNVQPVPMVRPAPIPPPKPPAP